MICPAQAISSAGPHTAVILALEFAPLHDSIASLITGEFSTLIDFQALKFHCDELRGSPGTGEVPSSAALGLWCKQRLVSKTAPNSGRTPSGEHEEQLKAMEAPAPEPRPEEGAATSGSP